MNNATLHGMSPEDYGIYRMTTMAQVSPRKQDEYTIECHKTNCGTHGLGIPHYHQMLPCCGGEAPLHLADCTWKITPRATPLLSSEQILMRELSDSELLQQIAARLARMVGSE